MESAFCSVFAVEGTLKAFRSVSGYRPCGWTRPFGDGVEVCLLRADHQIDVHAWTLGDERNVRGVIADVLQNYRTK